MPKNPHPGRIKKHRVYTPAEAAKALDLHRQTLLRWIKGNGLVADCSRRPWLIEGAVLKVFLAERRASGKCTLRMEQIYCLPCRRAQLPDGRLADFRLTSRSVGMLMGLCPTVVGPCTSACDGPIWNRSALFLMSRFRRRNRE